MPLLSARPVVIFPATKLQVVLGFCNWFSLPGCLHTSIINTRCPEAGFFAGGMPVLSDKTSRVEAMKET